MKKEEEAHSAIPVVLRMMAEFFKSLDDYPIGLPGTPEQIVTKLGWPYGQYGHLIERHPNYYELGIQAGRSTRLSDK